jgi:hypothetical protein
MEFAFMNETETRPIVANKAAARLKLAFLICSHIVVCCVSLAHIGNPEIRGMFLTAPFHVFFDAARWQVAVIAVTAFALVSSVFLIARFSFGYFVGFYSYTMIVGYLWLNSFTDLHYDHRLSGLSAAASAIAFLLPALFISAPVRQISTMTPRSFDRLVHTDT